MTKILGILGGMGPNATALFYKKIIQKTSATCDQDHIPTLIYSNPKIPDRTQNILEKTPNVVKKELIKSLTVLINANVSCIAIPCNTAHYWIKDLQKETQIPILNMIQETRLHIESKEINRVGIVGTLGTMKTQIYQKEFQKSSITLITPSKKEQSDIMEVITQIKNGNSLPELQQKMTPILTTLQESRASKIILGCTELPLLFEDLNIDFVIDPMDILAEKSINTIQNN